MAQIVYPGRRRIVLHRRVAFFSSCFTMPKTVFPQPIRSTFERRNSTLRYRVAFFSSFAGRYGVPSGGDWSTMWKAEAKACARDRGGRRIGDWEVCVCARVFCIAPRAQSSYATTSPASRRMALPYAKPLRQGDALDFESNFRTHNGPHFLYWVQLTSPEVGAGLGRTLNLSVRVPPEVPKATYAPTMAHTFDTELQLCWEHTKYYIF